MNDLEAMACAVPWLEPDEVAVVREGDAVPDGNAALIAAGTGLGEAMLHNVGGRFIPAASEGGHADFAPRTAREFDLAQHLFRMFGRVENERIISGPGLVNVYRFTHAFTDDAARCRAVGDVDDDELPAAITGAALSGGCAACRDALEIFVEAYASEAGNLALRTVATAGVYLGGGIAPKILPALTDGRFVAAFHDKPPMTDLLRTMPITVILNAAAGLIGAAIGSPPRGARAAR
jgi:glucokinase